MYAELMRDPGLPDAEADELGRFVHRTGWDVSGLTRTYQQLRDVLRPLAADADVPSGAEATQPGAVTQALTDDIYAQLTRGTAAAGD